MRIETGTLEDFLKMLGGGGSPPKPDAETVRASKFLKFMSGMGGVKRYHAVRRVVDETVPHHSANVALLCYYFSNSRPSVNLLMAALVHDAPEQASGDMNGAFKAKLGSVFREELTAMDESFLAKNDMVFYLTPKEQLVLHMADLTDGLLSCAIEHRMGNCMIHEAATNYIDALEVMLKRPEVTELAGYEAMEKIIIASTSEYSHD